MYRKLERLRATRQAQAERIWRDYLDGKISKRSLAAYCSERGRLSRIPDWMEYESEFSVALAAVNWLIETWEAHEAGGEGRVRCIDTLTDCMEADGAIAPDEAARRRELARRRHEETDYDDLLARGLSKEDARELARYL